jgi:predicted nucleic acid-binding protein
VIEFFDTSVLTAASQQSHKHYERSLPRVLAAVKEMSFCSVHTIAEYYSNLTRLPPPFRLPPEQARVFLHALRVRVSFVTLTSEEYFEAVDRLAMADRAGAQVFDALLLACARKVDAERIYTWNLKHFRVIAPDLAGRIVEP